MIQKAENKTSLHFFLDSYLLNKEPTVNQKEINAWKDELFEGNGLLFEVHQNEHLIAVFHYTNWEDIIHLDFVFCNNDAVTSVYNEIYTFLKEKYSGRIVEYLFYDSEAEIKRVLEKLSFNFRILTHTLEFNSSNIINQLEENKYSVCPYQDSFSGLVKKLKLDSKIDNNTIFIALKKKKPIGLIKISAENNEIYIEEVKVLPKYRKKGLREVLVKSILKKFLGYNLSVIVSHYQEDDIEFYLSLGFEINPKRTFVEATITL